MWFGMKMWPLSREGIHSGSENTQAGWHLTPTAHHFPCPSRFISTTFLFLDLFLDIFPCRLCLSLHGAAGSLNQGSASSCSISPVPAALPGTWEHQYLSTEWLIWLVLTYVQGCISFFFFSDDKDDMDYSCLSCWYGKQNMLCEILTLRSISCLSSK